MEWRRIVLAAQRVQLAFEGDGNDISRATARAFEQFAAEIEEEGRATEGVFAEKDDG